MSSLEEEEQTISISKRKLSELESKANAATDFIQHFKSIDIELKKEKAKVKKFTKMLIDDQKVIEKLTSVRCLSASDVSSLDSRLAIHHPSLIAPSIEIDGSSGPSINFPFSDPFMSQEPSLGKDKNLQKSQTKESNVLSARGNASKSSVSSTRSDSTSLGHVSLPYKRSASVNVSVGGTKSSNALDEVVDSKGVSESVFLNLVRELKRTKHCLNQLMLERGLTLEEFMKGKVDRSTLEDMAANIDELKRENKDYQNKISELNNSLIFYKKLVRDEREGVTMLSDSHSLVKSRSLDAHKIDEETQILKVQNADLKNQLMALEEEKNLILDNYAKCIRTITELEHHLNEDQHRKKNELLSKEVEKLQVEIRNLQNDNEKLVSSVSHHSQFREKWKDEHTKLINAEASLKEEKVKQQRMETEITLLKAKVKHLYKQLEPGKSQKSDRIQAPVKPTKITKQSLPVESTSSIIETDHPHIASTSLTGVKIKDMEEVKKTITSFECERCQAQFEDEMEHLSHINKCLD